MLNSIEIRDLITAGMVHCETVPENMQNAVLMRHLVEEWDKRMDLEGGYLDLTCGAFMSLAGNACPVIGLTNRVTPNVIPIRWSTDFDIPYITIHPDEYVLWTCREIFDIPEDISIRLENKSTLHRDGSKIVGLPRQAPDELFRYGAEAYFSPAHPGYKGRLTLGLKNLGPLPITIHYGARLITSSYHRVNAAKTTTYHGPHQCGVVTSAGKEIGAC